MDSASYGPVHLELSTDMEVKMQADFKADRNLIQHMSDEFGALLRSIRQDIHAHPELSMQENWTTDFIRGHLARWDIPVVPLPSRGTGLVAMLKSGTGDRAIGLRADIDALPIEETTSVPYRSNWPGRMHACGH